jgi:hypothetical protein
MFAGGFVEGFRYYPIRLYKGMFDTSPEIIRQTGRDLRTVRALADKYPPNRENRDRAREAYSQLPPTIREGLQLGVAQTAGGIFGGMLASYLIAGVLGLGAARMAVVTLGRRGTLHAPHWQRMTVIFGGAALSWYSMMGSAVDYVQRRNQLLQQLPPEQQRAIEEATAELLGEHTWDNAEGSGSPGSKKHQ